MGEGKVKSAKVKVHQPPAGTTGVDGAFHVYTFDAYGKTFLPQFKTWDNVEKAVSYQRHEQERIYAEQEADPEFFDLPFISSDPDLIARAERDAEYRDQLVRTLSAEARQRARKR